MLLNTHQDSFDPAELDGSSLRLLGPQRRRRLLRHRGLLSIGQTVLKRILSANQSPAGKQGARKRWGENSLKAETIYSSVNPFFKGLFFFFEVFAFYRYHFIVFVWDVSDGTTFLENVLFDRICDFLFVLKNKRG